MADRPDGLGERRYAAAVVETHKGHRGLHPQDPEQFLDARQATALRTAAGDLVWLLDRGYAIDASLKLVGDRYGLRKRQRMALMRSVCAPTRAATRRARQLGEEALRGATVLVDGLNQLITVEVAFSGGVLLRGSDGALRDLASIHGTYRLVSETPRAAEAVGGWLSEAGVVSVTILLDRPVSNSGRLAGLLRRIAAERGWPWCVETVDDVDRRLKRSTVPVATSDGAVLDAQVGWFDLAGGVVDSIRPRPHILYVLPQHGGRTAL